MKTQINTIVKGDALTAGTNYDIRKAIADKVFAENLKTLTLSYNLDGEELRFELVRHSSLSGKTQWYFGDVTAEQACRFVSNEGAKKRLQSGAYEANIILEASLMLVKLCIYRRRCDRWEQIGYQGRAMENKNVTIL